MLCRTLRRKGVLMTPKTVRLPVMYSTVVILTPCSSRHEVSAVKNRPTIAENMIGQIVGPLNNSQRCQTLNGIEETHKARCSQEVLDNPCLVGFPLVQDSHGGKSEEVNRGGRYAQVKGRLPYSRQSVDLPTVSLKRGSDV